MSGLVVIRKRGDYTLMTDGIWHRDEFPERSKMDDGLRWITKLVPDVVHYREFLGDDARVYILAYDPDVDRWFLHKITGESLAERVPPPVMLAIATFMDHADRVRTEKAQVYGGVGLGMQYDPATKRWLGYPNA